MVVDFGASGLIVDVISVQDGIFETISKAQQVKYSGSFFDKDLFKHCIEHYESVNVGMKWPTDDKLAKRRLEVECEKAKVALSKDSDATIFLK